MVHPIHNDNDHAAALARIRALWKAETGTPEFEELELLATLTDAYEREHHAIEPPSPIGQVRYLLDQELLTPTDLRRLIGETAA